MAKNNSGGAGGGPSQPNIPLQSFSGGSCNPRGVIWNSLEGRPRSQNIDRALKAEVRDALWMMSRQWQWGEFEGEDAGSMVFSRFDIQTTKLNRYAVSGGDAFPYDGGLPLETQVEREAITIDTGMRLEMGRHWLKLLNYYLAANGVAKGTYDQGYINTYGFVMQVAPPTGPGNELALIEYGKEFTNRDAWNAQVAGVGRAVDGYQVWQAINGGSFASDGVVPGGHHAIRDQAAQAFQAWFARSYSQPGEEGESWAPGQLEYSCQVAAPRPGQPSSLDWLVADEHSNGHLDWYSFDLAPSSGFTAPSDASGQSFSDFTNSEVLTTIPTPLRFKGMPNARWWEFEDRKVDWGGMDVPLTDVSKLLLLDFTFNFGNDWYLVPYRAEVGSLVSLNGIEVQDVFGVRTLIRHANEGNPNNWKRWNMYSLTPRGEATSSETRLFVSPAAMQVMEGPKFETVNFIRDEMANMAWGIEKLIPDGLFGGRDGQEAALDLFDYLKENAPPYTPPMPVDTDATIEYKVATKVQENWIPFIPNHVSSANRGIRLQRAAMPRDIMGMNTPVVEPRSVILRPGMEASPPQPYYVNEEEVTQAGTLVHRNWQRTRWHDGSLHHWVGRRKRTGTGGGYSGLKFDQVDVKE